MIIAELLIDFMAKMIFIRAMYIKRIIALSILKEAVLLKYEFSKAFIKIMTSR